MKSRVACVSVLLIFLFSISIVSAIPDTKFSKTKNGVLFKSDIDTSTITIEKSDEEIKISSSEHKETEIKIKKEDIEEIKGNHELLLVSHYDDTGYCDWSKIVIPEYTNGYLELDVEFSTVTIEVYQSTVKNPFFESWSDSTTPANWTSTDGGGWRSSGSIAGGNYSYAISGNGINSVWGQITQATTLTPGTYTIGAWIQEDARSTGNLNIDLYGTGYDSNGIIVGDVNPSNTWVWYEKTETVTISNPTLRIFTNDNPNYGSLWRIDGIYVAPAANPISATETADDDGITVSYTISPSTVYSYAYHIYSLNQTTTEGHGYCTILTTIDGVTKNSWVQGDMIYVDVSGLSAGSHSVVCTISYAQAPPMKSPTNGSTITFNYPPAYDDVTFSWYNFGGTSQIQVAEDSAFANVVFSEETTGNSATASLMAGTYYWRVRSYDSVSKTYGDWPTEYSVILVANSGSVSGTGIMGTVYYSAGLGNYQYIQGAVVTISNETYTMQKTTGSVGYYQVLGLSNGTYYISVEADGYDSTPSYAVNVTSGKVSIQDVAMQKEQSYFAPHYVKILIKEKSIFGIIKTPVSDATVTVYENSNTNMLTSQKTGSDGAVGFELSENVRYRIVVEKDGVTQTEYLTPTSSSYEIVLGESSESVLPESQFYEVCNISVDKTAVNSSTARVDISYNDSSENTNLVYFTISRPAGNGTLTLLNTSESYTENCTTSFYVSDYKGETFTVKAFIDHSLFGTVDKSFAVSFSGSNLPFAGKSMAILAIIVLFFVGSMFGRGDIGYAGIIVCGLGYFFWYMDIFESLGSIVNNTIWVGLVFASVFSIILIFNEKRTEGGI